jgi:hypothetical protein
VSYPCVIYRRYNGEIVHVPHGTVGRAQRNAEMVGMEYHWHETPSRCARLRSWLRRSS